MTESLTTAHASPHDRPKVNRITLDHPWRWLAAGWQDILRAPRFSLSYGAIFVAVSWMITLGLFNEHLFFMVPPLVAGFFLMAPLLGIGLYQISASLERGEKLEFCQAWKAWQRNDIHLASFAVVLLLVLLGWMLAALLVFALLFQLPPPPLENFVSEVFLSGKSPLFLFSGIAVGGVIALFAFSISVITTPLLMDRPIDVVSAMRTSWEAVRSNWQPLALWAVLIVMFGGVGLVTFYLGLIVTMPLVGHATWHAYRDLVPQD
jgi:uncharacterized membrane protein